MSVCEYTTMNPTYVYNYNAVIEIIIKQQQKGDQSSRASGSGEERKKGEGKVLRTETDQIMSCAYKYDTMNPIIMYNYNAPLNFLKRTKRRNIAFNFKTIVNCTVILCN